MKKLIIISIILILITGCNTVKDSKNKPIKKSSTTTENIENEKEDNYIDNNPIKLGMYLYTNSNTDRKLTREYTTNWNEGTDLLSLEVYYTLEENIPGTNQKQLWNTYYNNYQNINNYHIGYLIEFTTNEDEKISKYILSPSDTDEIFGYIQIYLYDDINQNSNWYDHLTKEEYNDSSILSSIKLTGSYNTKFIESPITLTAFTYDTDDFDNNNNYRGISKFTTIIKRS